MLPGFEDITADLTQEELDLVPVFVKGFSDKIGEAKAITAFEICKALRDRKISGARVRKIVNYIRMNKLVHNLVASSKGYYIETDPAKLAEYRRSLKLRARAINAVADSYEI
jgi:hypothetical protein